MRKSYASRGARHWILQLVISAMLATSLMIPAQAQLQGDANNDGCVNDLDLMIVLFNFGTLADPRGDVNNDGVIDDLDLLIVLFWFGECAPRETWKMLFGEPFYPNAIQFNTTSGNRTSQVDGGVLEIEFLDMNENGQVPIRFAGFTLGAQSFHISSGVQSGGVALVIDFEGDSSGLFLPTLNTSNFSFTSQVDLFYEELNRRNPSGTFTGGDEVKAAKAPATVTFQGTAQSFGDDYKYITGTLQIQVLPSGVDSPIISATFPVIGDMFKKPLLIECPARTTNKRKVCIQPVFIGSGPNDPNRTGSSFAVMKAEADRIWAKACIEFNWNAPLYVNNNNYKILTFPSDAVPAQTRALISEIDLLGNNACIEVFFVDRLLDGSGQRHEAGDGFAVFSGTKQVKVVIADDAVSGCNPPVDRVLAHDWATL